MNACFMFHANETRKLTRHGDTSVWYQELETKMDAHQSIAASTGLRHASGTLEFGADLLIWISDKTL